MLIVELYNPCTSVSNQKMSLKRKERPSIPSDEDSDGSPPIKKRKASVLATDLSPSPQQPTNNNTKPSSSNPESSNISDPTMIKTLTECIMDSPLSKEVSFIDALSRCIAEYTENATRKCSHCKAEFYILWSQKSEIFVFCASCRDSECSECGDTIKQKTTSIEEYVKEKGYDSEEAQDIHSLPPLCCAVNIGHKYSWDAKNCGHCHPAFDVIRDIQFDRDDQLCICNECLLNKMECCYLHGVQCPIYFKGNKKLYEFEQNEWSNVAAMVLCHGKCGTYVCRKCVIEQKSGGILKYIHSNHCMEIFCDQCKVTSIGNEFGEIDWNEAVTSDSFQRELENLLGEHWWKIIENDQDIMEKYTQHQRKSIVKRLEKFSNLNEDELNAFLNKLKKQISDCDDKK